MNRDSFMPLFIQHLAQPLLARGYRFVGKGQTLAYDASDLTLALIRLGGKRAQPGSIAHVLCARHRFLRTLEEEAVPSGDTLSVNDYPYKFRPSSLLGLPPSRWRYRPSNLGHWEYDRLDYGGLGPNEVRSDLVVLRELLAGPAVSWASALTPQKVAEELHTYGENAWCERLWLEDYRGRLGQGAGAGEQEHPEDRTHASSRVAFFPGRRH
jgi:hypothetical protein